MKSLMIALLASFVACSVLAAAPIADADDEPLATIAVIANPYLTTLPKEAIRDETGRLRDFLADTGRPSMERTVKLVNQLQPDAMVVLGSCTWSGREQDFTAFTAYLDRIEAPVFVTPGHRDLLDGKADVYRRAVADRDVSDQVRRVGDVALAFSSSLHTESRAACRRLAEQLASPDIAKRTVLLFAARDRTMGASQLPQHAEAFDALTASHSIALRVEPSRYAHRVDQQRTLPVWTVGSTAWTTRGAVSVLRVFRDRIEAAEIARLDAPAFRLTVPNPKTADRLTPPEQDPYQCPTYSQDLGQQPDFTFALVSDPQFDREAGRQYLIDKAERAIAELNRLRPAMVFVSGDLVNNNLPEEWKLFKRVFDKLEPPCHFAPGNHDVLFNYDFVESSYASAPQKRPDYARIVAQAVREAKAEGLVGPAALFQKHTGAKPQQRIEHRDAAFVIVPFLTTRADAPALDYLRTQLNATSGKRHVFVVAHYPALPAFGNNVQPQLGGDQVLAMLREHRVTSYLCGHRHRNGFQIHQGTAHVLADNMLTLHLFHVFADRIVIGRKTVGSPLYERLTIDAAR